MALIIFIVTVLFMMSSLLFFPKIKLRKVEVEAYWVITVIGALILIIFNQVNLSFLWTSFSKNSEMNAWKLVILFIMMTILSLFLDEIGFFKWLALLLLRKVSGKQMTLFVAIYLLVSILTIFTSNDVIILTLTPLIAYFAKNAKINPLPYLFGVLTAANTWSIMLIIGNPTNIYLAVNQNITFLTYFHDMWLPGLVAGLTGFVMVYLTFYKTLKKPMLIIDEKYSLPYPFLTGLGLFFLILTLVLLAISNFIGLPMWFIVLLMTGLLTLSASIYFLIKKTSFTVIFKTYQKAPWTFIPLIFSMFVLVSGIQEGTYLEGIVTFLNQYPPIFSYGVSSYLMSNLMNNQPMSMLYALLLEQVPLTMVKDATYASIIGSNIGVLLTPLGALAGLMWMSLLHKQGINLSFFDYLKKSFLIGIVTLFMSLLTLYLI